MNENEEDYVVPKPTPGPMPAPNPTPTPQTEGGVKPTPTVSPTPTTSQIRFIDRGGDPYGKKIIYDLETNYTIQYSKDNGYVAYDLSGKEVYHLYPDGTTSIRLEDGRHIVTHNIKSIEDISNYIYVTDDNGVQYSVHDGRIITKVIHYDDGTSEKYCYNLDNSYEVRKQDGNIIYYDSEGNEYKHVYPGGYTSYKSETNESFVIYENGTYTYYGKKNESGTYRIDDDGNFICYDDVGNITKRNSLGKLLEYDGTDGSHITFDYDKKAQVKTRNGNTSYSMMHHIEYDEEAYDDILNTFIGINESCSEALPLSKNNITNTISLLPDTYSSGTIEGICNSIITNIQYVDSIKEMTNYSLLAYQTCDDKLKENLEILIDSLFEDNESNLAYNFKKAISSNLEDRNDDTILEYKSDTNFKWLYENVIPSEAYTDDDGNIWYFNQRNLLIGINGEDLKFNYCGETFHVNYDKDGILYVTDTNGNPLNIFADYNIESGQFGSNQGAFSGSSALELLKDPTIQTILEDYYPGASDEEKLAYLEAVANTGCGNAAITNLVFKKFEGNEDDFYNTFGFSMYNIKKTDGSMSLDYNYEPVLLDLFSGSHKRNTIKESTRSARGTSNQVRDEMEKHLKNNYGITLDNLPENYVYLGEYGYSLYNMDGTLYFENGEGHAMIVVGKTDDGDQIVSSWGKKYILKSSNWLFDSLKGSMYKKEYK